MFGNQIDSGPHPALDHIPTPEPELVFGLVGPLGSNIDATQEALVSELRKVGYEPVVVHLTRDVREIISEAKARKCDTFSEKIDLMNEIVSSSATPDFLARTAIAIIIHHRVEANKPLGLTEARSQFYQSPRKAYIIRQLKRQQEAITLQTVYGKNFIQVSVVISESEQMQIVSNIVGKEQPELPQHDREEEARKLIKRDYQESGIDHGQRVVNIHHFGDVFVSGTAMEISSQVARFIESFFGSNYISPTKDEFGSHLAKAASFRTLDLSRQVGAAIVSQDGDIISLGCNEVPRPMGGNYWCDDEAPQRDIERGVEPNKLETTRIIYDLVHAISKLDGVKLDPSKVLKNPKIGGALDSALVSDLTEFGRITHAEMSALSDAARLGRATAGATLYVTTFPCHNCAKHLVAAGIRRIVYIEPYAKSKALELSGDAITGNRAESKKVLLEHFVGISPRRYRDIFEKTKKRRDDNNVVKRWHFDTPTPLVDDKYGTHTAREWVALVGFNELVEQVNRHLLATRAKPQGKAIRSGRPPKRRQRVIRGKKPF